jgi:hypothetical protein
VLRTTASKFAGRVPLAGRHSRSIRPPDAVPLQSALGSAHRGIYEAKTFGKNRPAGILRSETEDRPTTSNWNAARLEPSNSFRKAAGRVQDEVENLLLMPDCLPRIAFSNLRCATAVPFALNTRE